MNSKKRKQNEKDFTHWIELDDGGRKYWYEVIGRKEGKAKYIKTVNEKEETISFIQEVYNIKGALIEIHEKFPIDKGHKKV